MATFIDDKRLNDDNEEQASNIEELGQEAPQEPTPSPEDTIPEKYQGKSTAEIVRMHQEAEKLLGKQSGEVGELRSVVDSYIQTQLDTTPVQATPTEDEDIDFFSDPDKAVERAIRNHPSIKKAEETTLNNQRTNAMSQLQSRHPDMEQIVQDGKFVEWIKASKIRTQLFAQADRQYDYEAADELFTNWKERQGAVAQTVAAEKDTRKAAVKAASTGSTKGNGEQRAKKIYRRSDIIKLMQDDPDRYLALSDEITQAYAEKRVR
tara:strand:- start:20966 stop:21757 length:792 start_codon:yes stop_codon:yes gene_type:complete